MRTLFSESCESPERKSMVEMTTDWTPTSWGLYLRAAIVQ